MYNIHSYKDVKTITYNYYNPLCNTLLAKLLVGSIKFLKSV